MTETLEPGAGIDWRARAERLWDEITACSDSAPGHREGCSIDRHIEAALREAALSNPMRSPPAEGAGPSLEQQLSEAVARGDLNWKLAMDEQARRLATEKRLSAERAAHAERVEALERHLATERGVADGRYRLWGQESDNASKLLKQLAAAEARAEALAGLLRRAVVLHQYEPLSGSGNVTPCRACGRFFYQHMRDNEDRGWCHSPADAALESPRPTWKDADHIVGSAHPGASIAGAAPALFAKLTEPAPPEPETGPDPDHQPKEET